MAQKCEDHGSCWPSAMISTIFVSGGQNYRVRHRRPELADDDLGLREDQRLLVERELVGLDRHEAKWLQRLDHRGAIGDVAAV